MPKLITNPEDLKLIQEFESGIEIIESRHVKPGVVYLASKPEIIETIPVRTELTVLSADRASSKVTGWSMTETIGMSVVNPRAASRMTFNPLELPVVLFWPVPDHPGNNLKIVYRQDLDQLEFFLLGKKSNVSQVLQYGERGFSKVYGSDQEFGAIPGDTTAKKLCWKICSSIAESTGPSYNDPRWQALIDDLPNALITARVMLS
jgi:hypothetical protein